MPRNTRISLDDSQERPKATVHQTVVIPNAKNYPAAKKVSIWAEAIGYADRELFHTSDGSSKLAIRLRCASA